MTTALTASDLRQRLIRLWPSDRTRRFAIACSGGADSLALALLMAEAFPGAVTALIVDHRLRTDSTPEARQVSAWLGARAIPHEILAWDTPKPSGGLQTAARDTRYALMTARCKALGLPTLLTAHHADDQAETLLLALKRGSGLAGLAGIPPIRMLNGITLLRPVLDVPKAALVAALQERQQDWIKDPSNENRRFDRVQVRLLMPELAKLGLTPASLTDSAARLADAHTLIAEQITAFKSSASAAPGSVNIPKSAILGTSAAFQRVVVRAAITDWLTALGSPPRGADVMRLIDWIIADCPGGVRSLARCRVDGRDANTLTITPEPQ
jgi:tRNA(Ile)-lysidine synthase